MLSIFEPLQSIVMSENSAALKWSNPLMVVVLSLDILYKLQNMFRSLSIRITGVCEKVQKASVKIYSNYEDPEKMEVLLRQKDLEGKAVF